MVQRRERTEVRQGQIIDAARKLIIRYGSEHVTVRRIAKEVGISEGAIYRHFKSKREILSLLADYIGEILREDVEANYTPGKDPLEALNAIIKSHFSAIAQRKGITFQIIAEIVSLGDKKLNKKISIILDEYLGRINNILSEGVKRGEVRQDIDLDAGAYLFFGMVEGIVDVWTLSNYTFDIEQNYLPLWNIYRKGIST